MLCFINPWLAWMLREKKICYISWHVYELWGGKEHDFSQQKKKLILGLLSTSFFQPIVSTCYSLNLKTIARMRVELYGRLFLKHRNISRHGQKMSNSGTDSVMISWSPSRHGGERENQIDFGNKIFVFLSSWKIDAGCIWWNAMSLLVCAEACPPLSNRTKRG